MPAHNIPMALLGTFILAFGWFGFNPGSTLGAPGGGLNRIGIVAVATMLASAGGTLAAAAYMTFTKWKPDPTMCANGMPAGLVAITLRVWAFGFSSLFFKILDKVMGMRVTPEVEIEGLDIDETGVLAYPGFTLSSAEMVAMREVLPAQERAAVQQPV
jgi:ammonium transporter, Amt family